LDSIAVTPSVPASTPPAHGRLSFGGRLRAALRFALPAFSSGALAALAFPTVNAWPLAWVALAPWYGHLCALADASPVTKPASRIAAQAWLRAGTRSGFLVGFFLFLVGMTWMNEIGAGPWIVLSAIEALPFALLGLAAVWLFRRLGPSAAPWLRPLALAALWTLADGLRTQTRYSFPWFMLAATQVRALPLVQVVSLAGQWGLTFALVLSGALLGEAWRQRRRGNQTAFRLVGAALVVPAALALGGALALSGSRNESQSPQPVAIAQGNITKTHQIEDGRSGVLDIYEDLTRQAALAPNAPRPLFVAWPETVVPGLLLRDPELLRRIGGLARATNTPLVVGSVQVDDDDRLYNSAFLVNPDGAVAERYDKTQLVPAGEFFPLRSFLASAYKAYGAPPRDFAWGGRPGLFTTEAALNRPSATLGVLICYESAFGRLAADRARGGAQLLVLLTSDQTFGTTAGPYQHADLCVLRAVETRRYLVRAASTGVSEIVDPWGRIRSSLPIGVRGALVGDVRLRTDRTPYVRWGDWFPGVCAAFVVLLAATGGRLPGRERPVDRKEKSWP